jgi:hypothetical protein
LVATGSDSGLAADGTGMVDDEAPKTYGELSPETALSLLGNEVRASVLWALSRARGGQGPPPVLSFSELREQADVDVDSSRFNYHLQELVGTFVERVEPGAEDADAQVVPEMAMLAEEGFRLRPEGTTLIRTVRAWSVAGAATLDPFEIGTSCHHCGTTLVAEYDNAIFAIQCPDCEYLYDYNLTPPGILDGETDRVLERVAEYNRHQRLAFARGSCPLCGHGVDIEFQVPAETGYPRSDLREVLVRRGCLHCGHKDNLTLGELLLRDAGLIAFCHEQGRDVTTTPIWELEFAATDRHTAVRSRDPWRLTLSVSGDDDTLELDVDETLTVVERRRV